MITCLHLFAMDWTFRPFEKPSLWKWWTANQGEYGALTKAFCFCSYSCRWVGSWQKMVPTDIFEKQLLRSVFFWHKSKGIEVWFKSDGTVASIVLIYGRLIFLVLRCFFRAWFFPAKTGLNQHLETLCRSSWMMAMAIWRVSRWWTCAGRRLMARCVSWIKKSILYI